MITKNINGQDLSANYSTVVSEPNRDWSARLYADGVLLDCSIVSFEITKGSCGTDESFSIGNIISSMLEAELKELNTDIKGADIEVQIGLNTGTVEWVTLGHFIAVEVKKTPYTATLTGYGYSTAKAGGSFTLPSTLTLASIANSIGTAMGCQIVFDSDISAYLGIPIRGTLESNGCYEGLQVLAHLVGGYACDTNDGKIAIHRYKATPTVTVDSDRMIELPSLEEADFNITGAKVIVQEADPDADPPQAEISYSYGNPIVIYDENANMTQAIFDNVYKAIVGYVYRTGTVGISVGDPRIEGNDVVQVVDVDGTTYNVPCHSVTHTYDGGLSTRVEAVKATADSDGIYSVAPITQRFDELGVAVSIAKASAESAQASAESALESAQEAQRIVGELEDDVEDLNGRVSTAEGKITTIEGNITSLDGRVSTAEGKITTVEGDISDLGDRVDTAESDISTIEGNITTINGNVSNLTTRVQTAEGKVTTLEGDVDTLDTNVGNLTTRVTTAEGKITTAEGNITSLTTRVSDAETDIGNIEDDITSLDGRVSGAETDIGTIEGNITTINGQITTINGDIDDIEGDVSGLTTRVSTAEGKVTTLEGQVSTAQTNITNLQGRISTAESDISAVEGDITTLQGRVTDAESDVTETLNALSIAEAVIDTINWISDHGTMTLTTDTQVDHNKVYFVVDPNGIYEVGGTHYAIVENPVASGLSTYYELTTDSAISNYIESHITLTSAGLVVTKDNTKWYVLVKNDGIDIVDNTTGLHKVVASYGASVTVGQTSNGNIQITSSGININDGSDTVAGFTGDSITLGRLDQTGDTQWEFTRTYGRALMQEGFDTVEGFFVGLNDYGKAVWLLGGQASEVHDLFGAGSVGIGEFPLPTGDSAIATGFHPTASGTFSVAIGNYIEAHGQNETVIGRYNSVSTDNSKAFVIGNGVSEDNRSNGFVVDWNGLISAENVFAYGECATGASTPAKTVTVACESFVPVKGASVAVKFTNSNTVANPTLNVNGTGAKSIKRYGTTAPSTAVASSWNAGSVILFIYDGTYWQMCDWMNTTYSSMTEAEITAGTGTTARIITPARLKLAIQTWADANVQADWTQTDSSADDYIKNKPTIPTVSDTYSGTSSNAMSGKAVKSAIDALDGTITGTAGSGKTLTALSQTDGKVSATFGNISITKSQVSDFPTLATVATSGDYDDLSDKPQINGVTLASNKTFADLGLVDFFYPVGSYYETSDTTFDPNTAWGGTWVEDTAGRVTVAQDTTQTEFDTIGETGGDKHIQDHAHGFTQPKIPNHQHQLQRQQLATATSGSNRWFASGTTVGGYTANDGGGNSCTGGTVNSVQTTAHGTMTTGNSGNLQPYIVVKRWHRTA